MKTSWYSLICIAIGMAIGTILFDLAFGSENLLYTAHSIWDQCIGILAVGVSSRKDT